MEDKEHDTCLKCRYPSYVSSGNPIEHFNFVCFGKLRRYIFMLDVCSDSYFCEPVLLSMQNVVPFKNVKCQAVSVVCLFKKKNSLKRHSIFLGVFYNVCSFLLNPHAPSSESYHREYFTFNRIGHNPKN